MGCTSSSNGDTRLIAAVRENDIEIVTKLLYEGEDVNVNDKNVHGLTALMVACVRKVI